MLYLSEIYLVMKKWSLWLLLLMLSCKSIQTDLPLLQGCPSDGNCKVEVFKNSKIVYKPSEDNNIDRLSIEDNSDFQVIQITYTGSRTYSEDLYLQIPLKFKEIISENHSLQNQKVIFRKLCDCNDAGYEKIISGKLELYHWKDYISLHLEFNSARSQSLNEFNLDI